MLELGLEGRDELVECVMDLFVFLFELLGVCEYEDEAVNKEKG